MHENRWDDELVSTAKEILGQSETVTEAARELSRRVGRPINDNTIRKAFSRLRLGPPHHHLSSPPASNEAGGLSCVQGPEQPPFPAVPEGFLVRGVSTLGDAAGNTKLQWTKASRDEAERFRQMTEAIDRHVEHYGGIAGRIAPPADGAGDDLIVYPLGDPHIGMLAWASETGADFDLRIAERELLRAVDMLATGAPPGREAVLVNLGDFFHAQDDLQLTPMSKNKLDVDTRIGKIMDIGFAVARRAVETLLGKHEAVRVLNLRGNHDPLLSLMLDRWMRAVFENEPRVTITPADNPYQYIRHGRTLLGFHHGDGAKPAQLPAIMAADKPEDWGGTRFRYWLTGHVHRDSRQETPGCSVESFRTIANKDYWTHWKGYRSGQSLQCVAYSREFGEVARHRVSIEMVRET